MSRPVGLSGCRSGAVGADHAASGHGVVAVEEDDVVGDKKSESCGIEIREPAELVLDAGGKPVRGDIAVRDAAGTRQRRSLVVRDVDGEDRKSTRLNSSHVAISYAVFCLKKKKT